MQENMYHLSAQTSIKAVNLPPHNTAAKTMAEHVKVLSSLFFPSILFNICRITSIKIVHCCNGEEFFNP